jgi:uncharacterized membrane protein YqgA involved in biofilm formation
MSSLCLKGTYFGDLLSNESHLLHDRFSRLGFLSSEWLVGINALSVQESLNCGDVFHVDSSYLFYKNWLDCVLKVVLTSQMFTRPQKMAKQALPIMKVGATEAAK